MITSVLPVLQACMYLYNEMRSIFKHSLEKLKSLFQFVSVLNTNYVLGNSYFLCLIIFLKNFIYLFIYGCVGSLFLYEGFL